MRYPSKVDTWLVVLLAGAVALPITIGISLYVSTGSSPAMWLLLSIAGLMALIIFLVAVPTRYELRSDRLLIRSGLLHWEIPLSDVVSISPTSNPLSGPAWSLERLEVRWTRAGRTRSILISPRPADKFLREVTARNGTLVVANGGLQRAR